MEFFVFVKYNEPLELEKFMFITYTNVNIQSQIMDIYVIIYITDIMIKIN